jgi:D-alanine-D-alanine ligase
MRKLRVGLCYDLAAKHQSKPGEPRDKAAEFDSPETVQALQEVITSLGHEVLPIGDGQDLIKFLVGGGKIDLVFNIAEGLHGRSRESQVPALLEMWQIPYTGADPLTLALCLDKVMFKRVLQAEKIPTPMFREVHSAGEAERLDFPLPAFVKPAAEGSGKGIKADCRVDTLDALRKITLRVGKTYGWPILVEEFLPGMEITVGIVGNGDARVIGAMQIEFLPGSGGIYSYQTKKQYLKLVDYYVPPRLPVKILQTVEATALKTYHLTGCRDFGRVDLRLDRQGRPNVMEINPLAGLNPVSSDLVIMTKAKGIAYKALIGDIIDAALTRTGLSHS